MINEEFQKSIGLLTETQLATLSQTLVIIFGLGGVGGYCFDTLVRTGIGNFIIIDYDKFDISNMNRQLMCTYDTINKYKTEIYKSRALSINKNINIQIINDKVSANNITTIFENAKNFKYKNIYVTDCIDDIDAKFSIIKYCYENNLPIISCMGTANHINTSNIKIADINKTSYCPLAKKMRKMLKTAQINKLTTLFIEEEPSTIIPTNKISTIAYVPSVSGIKIAEYIIQKIIF